MQNSRYQKVEKFYEVPVFIAVVLLIPVIIIEYRSSGLKEFANYLNWGIWGCVFIGVRPLTNSF